MLLKKFCVLLSVSLSLLIPVSGFTTAVNASSSLSDSSEVSKTEAVAAALYQVKFDQALNEQSPWKGKNIKALDPIEVFDASDKLHSYIVNLQIGEQPAGYVEIGDNKNDFPVLSYSYTVSNTEFSTESIENSNINAISGMSADSVKRVRSEKVVCLSPGRFGLKVDYTNGSADLIAENKLESITASENTPVLAPEKSVNSESKKTWEDIETIAGNITINEIGTDTDGVTDSLSFEYNNPYSSINSIYYNGVTDENQWNSSLWSGPSGCAPTSAYNIFYYWHFSKGKSNLLVKDSNGNIDKDQTMLLLRNCMQTTDTGNTTLYNQASGLRMAALGRRYSGAASTLNTDASWSTVKSDLSYGPSLISFFAQTFYGYHSVTGVGYIEFIRNGSSSGHQYMEVYDNHSDTPTSVYIAYGRNYSSINSINFSIN